MKLSIKLLQSRSNKQVNLNRHRVIVRCDEILGQEVFLCLSLCSVWSSARYTSASAVAGSSNSAMICGTASRLSIMCSSELEERCFDASVSDTSVPEVAVLSESKLGGDDEVRDETEGGGRLYFAYMESRPILGSGTITPFPKRDSRYADALYAIGITPLLAQQNYK